MAKPTKPSKPTSQPLSPELKKQILSWCREIISAHLERKDPPPAPPMEGRRGGVFVTLKLGGRLRGCIGRFSFDDRLEDSISEMTMAAAFQDPRFSPLSAAELPDLEISVSVLTPLKLLKSLDDLVIGRDGLYIVHPKGQGVLLPVVAVERGYGKEEFARQTSLKAGLPPDAYKDSGATLWTFEAPAFSTNPDEK
jgi:AmmeMemoRadiSam system protein A